jgi:hypothetical protein
MFGQARASVAFAQSFQIAIFAQVHKAVAMPWCHCLTLMAIATVLLSDRVNGQELSNAPPAQDFSANWIAKFDKQYPVAAEALTRATNTVYCEGQYIAPLLSKKAPVIKKGSSAAPDNKVWLDFKISKNGERLRGQFVGENNLATIYMSNATNIYHIIQLDNSGEADGGNYRLVTSSDKSNDSANLALNLLARRFLNSTMEIWNYRPLIDVIKSGELTIDEAVPDKKVPNWVVYKVTYKDKRTPGRVGHGSITLSPKESWAIREYEYDWPFEVPFRVRAKVEVSEFDHLGVVPARYEYVSEIKRLGQTNWEEMERYECRFNVLRDEIVPESEFELAAFGLEGPPSKRRLFLWTSGGFMTLVFCIMLFRRAKAGRRPIEGK